LLHAGFSVPRMSPPGRWALTPPFHPCQMRLTESGRPLVLPRACRRGTSITGGLIFCGTFRSRYTMRSAFAKRVARPPGVTRRVALLWPTLASSPQLESGLSSRALPFREANRRSSDSPANDSIPCAHGSYNRARAHVKKEGSNTQRGGPISKPLVFRTAIRRGLARRAILPFHISSRGRRPRPHSWSSY
jgi:hypothetical protein